MVYSDRLHGAISAGLHSVPIMTLGWSFKYREMLGDYDLKWAQIKYSSEQQMLNSVLRIIKKYKNIQNFKASFSVEKIRFQNKLMWNKIFYQLNKLLPPKK